MLSSDELERFVLSLMPPSVSGDWRDAFADIGAKLSAYVQGVVLNGAIVGIVMGASLGLMGVSYALLLGFIAAIFQAIPMVGAVISGPVILVVVLATSGWEKMLLALAIFVVVQAIDQNVLSPIIFGQRVAVEFSFDYSSHRHRWNAARNRRRLPRGSGRGRPSSAHRSHRGARDSPRQRRAGCGHTTDLNR